MRLLEVSRNTGCHADLTLLQRVSLTTTLSLYPRLVSESVADRTEHRDFPRSTPECMQKLGFAKRETGNEHPTRVCCVVANFGIS